MFIHLKGVPCNQFWEGDMLKNHATPFKGTVVCSQSDSFYEDSRGKSKSRVPWWQWDQSISQRDVHRPLQRALEKGNAASGAVCKDRRKSPLSLQVEVLCKCLKPCESRQRHCCDTSWNPPLSKIVFGKPFCCITVVIPHNLLARFCQWCPLTHFELLLF